jgi:hypothetical protein
MKPFKQKVCRRCGVTFDPTAPAYLYCAQCAPVQAEETARRATERAQRKKLGARYGIGSGNAQGRGPGHHTWKNGISFFIQQGPIIKAEVRYCERCKKDLIDATDKEWVIHHRDHDRENNVRENFELLCKRCHQIEHRCWENFPQFADKKLLRSVPPNIGEQVA